MATSGIGGTQNVNFTNNVTPLSEMNLEQLMMFVVFQRMDANASQLRQHAAEMDVRTKKLEQLGNMSQALGGISNKFDKTEATQQVKDTPAGKNMTSDDWKNMEKDIKDIVIDGKTDTVPTPVAGGKDIKADQKGEAQTMKDNMIELARIGKESGLMTDADISRLSKGEFKKSEIEALQASIKTEQDKIGNENTKQQLTLQSITGRLESITNLAGTLTKKIGDIWNAIIQKT
jgi:hypothetical protein